MRGKTSWGHVFLCIFIKILHSTTAAKNEWTEQVKKDLLEFDIKGDIEWIKSKSKSSFKTLVKQKTKEVAANTLKQVKEGHSKMSNLEYKDLEMQVYLTDETIIKQERYTDSEIEWQDSGKISRTVPNMQTIR